MKEKKVYLQITGNCGNQFFQYAFARNIQDKFNAKLYIDYSYVLQEKDAERLGSMKLLDEFNVAQYMNVSDGGYREFKWRRALIRWIEARISKKGLEVGSLKKYAYIRKWSERLEKLGICYYLDSYRDFKIPRNCRNIYIQGYFESPKYFKDIDDNIIKELTPKRQLLEQNVDLMNIIKNTESVCISIKRMDLDVDNIADMYGYDIQYYYSAIDYINENVNNPVFIIFSDDLEWCRTNFKITGKTYYETEGNPMWEKIRLMSACKYFVIRNSTFSWWVQHLSMREGKEVIAPYKWLNTEQPIDIYDDNWIYMDDYGKLMDNHA